MSDDLSTLLASRYLSLETFRRDARAVQTPVWFAGTGDNLYVYTNRRTGKVKRLSRSARARVARCTVLGTVQGPWFETEARIVHDPAEIKRAQAALQARYGWQMRIAGWGAAIIGRLGERRFIRIKMPAATAVNS